MCVRFETAVPHLSSSGSWSTGRPWVGVGGLFFWGRLAGRPHVNRARENARLFIGVYRPQFASRGCSPVEPIDGPAAVPIVGPRFHAPWFASRACPVRCGSAARLPAAVSIDGERFATEGRGLRTVRPLRRVGIEGNRYFLDGCRQDPYGNRRETEHTCLRARGSTWSDGFPGNARQRSSADPRGTPPLKNARKMRAPAVWSTVLNPPRKSAPPCLRQRDALGPRLHRGPAAR